MNNFNRINTVLGWITFAVATIVYALTLEPSVSLWDCGEFISASYHLQIVHPPGAPLFLMIGRIFSLFAPGPEQVAIAVNMLSAVASAATVMFTFWITTHFAKKIAKVGLKDNKVEMANAIAILGSGLVAALSVTFMDTFWFSAVEAEVYAASSCFMALAFWAITKWEKVKDENGSDRWLVFIAYTVGLGIGLHLLNLLVIPAIVYYYYFIKIDRSQDGKSRNRHLFISTVVGFGIIALLQWFIIPLTPEIAANFDRLFVNSFGLPFNSGMLFFMILVGVTLFFAIKYSHEKNKTFMYIAAAGAILIFLMSGWEGPNIPKRLVLVLILVGGYYAGRKHGSKFGNLLLLCFSFIMLGFSSYSMVVIRSLAEPAIDMNDPEDAYSLLSYINREQYGDRPLVKGPYWMAQYVGAERKDGVTQYRRNEKDHEYSKIGKKTEYVWKDEYLTIFPRMGDMTEKAQYYHWWCGMQDEFNQIRTLEAQIKSNPPNVQELQQQLNQVKLKKPTFKNNLTFLFDYQIGWMYVRYFMWNFVGRQNDQQNVIGGKTQGNWISGIGPVDELIQGIPPNEPEYLKTKGRNVYYFLPLLLGILGMFIQAKSSKTDFFTVLAMFLFTGVLIVIYLNQPPMEPRERDYTFVGSFQTFCIWIGLSVMGIISLIQKAIKGSGASIAAVVIALVAAPVLMGSQNWDDHDRSDRYLGISYAKNYLESCEENAILFTNGDNDTYPLWYAQNVEGIRTDVRIINLSLLPTEWYSGALRRKVFKSEPLPMSIPEEKLVKGKREYLRFNEQGRNTDLYYPVNDVVDFATSEDRSKMAPITSGDFINYVPVRRLSLDVDKDAVIAMGFIPKEDEDRIVDKMRWNLGSRSGISKGDLVVLDIIATNAAQGWKRPIYWTTTTGNAVYLGMDKYLRHNGLTYQLIPVERKPGSQGIDDLDLLYDKLMNVYEWGNIDKGELFLDDKAQLVPQNLRNLFVNVAGTNVRLGKKDTAIALLDKCFESVPEKVLPMPMRLKAAAVSIYYQAGANEVADKKVVELGDDAIDLVQYYKEFDMSDPTFGSNGEMQDALEGLLSAYQVAMQNNRTEVASKYETPLRQYQGIFQRFDNSSRNSLYKRYSAILSQYASKTPAPVE